MADDAGLAHSHVGREAADGQALKPLRRGDLDGPVEDLGTGPGRRGG